LSYIFYFYEFSLIFHSFIIDAPKRKAEGLGAVQKGSGDKAVGVGLDSMSVKAATSAPKAVAESLGTVQKGSGDKAVGVGLDSMSVKSATSAPKAVAEGVPLHARSGNAAASQTEVAGVTYDEEATGDDYEEPAGDDYEEAAGDEYYDEE